MLNFFSSATTATSMSSTDVHYLKSVLGMALTLGLSEITAKQPKDPIHYLAHWLFKYRYNQEVDEARKLEIEALLEERHRLAVLALVCFSLSFHLFHSIAFYAAEAKSRGRGSCNPYRPAGKGRHADRTTGNRGRAPQDRGGDESARRGRRRAG